MCFAVKLLSENFLKLFKIFYSSWWMADQRPRGTCPYCPHIARILASVVPITSNVHYNPNFYCRQVCTHTPDMVDEPSTGCHFLHFQSTEATRTVWTLWYSGAVYIHNSWPQTRQHHWLNPDHQEANSGDQWRTVPLSSIEFHWGLVRRLFTMCSIFANSNDHRMLNTVKFTVLTERSLPFAFRIIITRGDR